MPKRVRGSSGDFYGILSNYCGLGGEGVARHDVDQLCEIHDRKYQRLIDEGEDPYWRFNDADQEFLDGLERVIPKGIGETILQKAAQWFFVAKKALSPGDTGEEQTPQKLKRPAELDLSTLKESKRLKVEGLSEVRRDLFGVEAGATRPTKRGPTFQNSTFGTSEAMTSAGRATGETPVMPYGSAKYIQPDYITQSFKWNWVDTNASSSSTNQAVRYDFRLNSGYDPNVDNTTQTGAGGELNASYNGWVQYASRYSYYRVLSNHVKIIFLKRHGADSDANVGTLTYQNSRPVIVGVNLNPANQYPLRANGLNWRALAQGRYSQWHVVTDQQDLKVIEFTYKPEAWDADIQTQQKAPLWTPINQNPTNQDRMTVWFNQIDFTNVRAYMDVIVEMNAVVQFREWSTQMKTEHLFFDTHGLAAPTEDSTTNTTATRADDLEMDDIQGV